MRTPLILIPLLAAALGVWWCGAPGRMTGAAPAEAVLRHNNVGVALLEQYDYDKAAAEFGKAVTLEPDFVPARVNLGISLYYARSYAKAREQFEEVLRRAPGEPHAHFMLAHLHASANRTAEAIAHFDRVLEHYPEDVATLYGQGLTYLRVPDYPQAVEALQKVIVLEPHNAAAVYNLATALLRMGRSAEGGEMMARFRQMRRAGGSANAPAAVMGSQYQEEGAFAQAITRYDIWPAGGNAANEVRFVDATRQAGIRFVHGAGRSPGEVFGPVETAALASEAGRAEVACALGSGAAFFDYDADGRLDIFLVDCGLKGGGNRLYRNNADGTFSDVTEKAGLAGGGLGMGVAAGDYNQDGRPDLYLTRYGTNRLYRNEGDGRFTDVTAASGTAGEETDWSLSAAWVDYDHDGDLDLFVTNFVDLARPPAKAKARFPEDFEGQPNRLFRNNGNGTFTEVSGEAGAARPGGAASVVPTDFNNSRDVDLLVTGPLAPPRLLSNRRDGTFGAGPAVALPDGGRALGVAVADVNKDSFSDFFFPAAARGRLGYLLVNQEGRNFKAQPVAAGNGSGAATGWSSAFLDYDNDGVPDLLVLAGGAHLLHGEPRGEFADATAAAGLDKVRLGAPRGLAAADYDGDGDLDVLVTNSGGAPVLLRNDGGNRRRHLRVRLDGLNDNKIGMGARVEVRAGSLWQRAEVTGGAGYLGQGTTELVFGVGEREGVEAVKVLWATGVLQAEVEPPLGRTLVVKQLDRKGTSCPILYAWNGSQYGFVTDFLGGSAFGYLLAPGQYNTPDTDEYVLVEPARLKPRNGFYSLKMVNQLEEVIFFDEARLVAVDHPGDVRVFPNERLMPGPPYPEFRVYTSRKARPPLAATDERGHDILPLIREIDRRYPDGFRLLPFKGYAEPHSMVLDLGDLRAASRVVLLLHAWIDYADSTSNLAASQAGVSLLPPVLEVADGNGGWQPALPNMGFPAGLPKTMVVDLTGKFPSRDYRVRITTSMRIYWDQVLVDTSQPAPVRLHRLPVSRALLGWGGYPAETSEDGRKPFGYDYERRSVAAPWKEHAGRYTRYGDVLPLLSRKDDLYVITRHGDEITLDFDARRLPSLPAGWTRSFLVYADGFGKDMDVNSANAGTVGPLPFHGMPRVLAESMFPARKRTELERYGTRLRGGVR